MTLIFYFMLVFRLALHYKKPVFGLNTLDKIKNSVALTPPQKVFAWLFLLTGIFSIVSSLFAWGEGWLFTMTRFDSFLLPMADLLTTAPLSLLTAYGIFKKKHWGHTCGVLTSGMYMFGSVIVFITLFWKEQGNALELLVPSLSGFALALSFFIFNIKKRQN